MKFGKVTNTDGLDLTLPNDQIGTAEVLSRFQRSSKLPSVYTGFAKWNRDYLKTFYPKGTGKNDLEYYSSQVNCIEMNAFFYRIFPKENVRKWFDRTTNDFKFCPKIPQSISQFRRLKNCEDKTTQLLESISEFKEKLGPVFLQMHPTFKPDKFQDLVEFVRSWPNDVPLTIELRHTDWYSDSHITQELYTLLETHKVGNTITDTAGRRDLLHMRLTNSTCFVRFTGTNHTSDYHRIDAWIQRLRKWSNKGIENIYFFVHQNDGHKTLELYRYFIKEINAAIGCSLKSPIAQNA